MKTSADFPAQTANAGTSTSMRSSPTQPQGKSGLADYSSRQSARDAEYERDYRRWVASLPADERRRLRESGLDRPCVQRHGTGGAWGDAADSPLMAEGCDPMLAPEPEPDTQPQPAAAAAPDHELVWAAVRRILGELLQQGNPRLTVECLALVSGLAYTGASMSEIARRHGITRAAVSKRCVELTEQLDLRPSRAMRSLTARQRYRAARIKSNRSNEPQQTPPK